MYDSCVVCVCVCVCGGGVARQGLNLLEIEALDG